ncbi:cupredoxin family copper-binding protein [Acidisoma cellulosilytica]|uniref:Cupredoxin family copper-binding protein n=1 Tax=Acidisoma cellulosilyticum TaxID=2802395 RepID=A0A963Z535_9PROT|nr:cupredoxin family copper-binding protein [Acidisoma cellulosilyticum]MCB8882696.1 cupredoxin family copper-binding protein [Acidisoma cellulosilyticum]
MLKAMVFSVALLIAPLAQAATLAVTVDDYSFAPDSITIHPGDTVSWQNNDSVPHTATALDGKSFDSGTLDPGARWSFTFKMPGHYPYRCAIHPDMRGTIIVQ